MLFFEISKHRILMDNLLCWRNKEALAIRHIFSLVDMLTKAKFSNSTNDFKIRLIG